MMLFKKISILFLVIFISCGTTEEDVEVTQDLKSNSDQPTTTIEEQEEENDVTTTTIVEEENDGTTTTIIEEENDGTTTTTIEEVVEETEESSSEIVVSIGEIVTDTQYRDYQKYVDVTGLRIFALPEVSDEFMSKVAETYSQMLQPGENIDTDLRSRYLKIVENEKVFQRIGYVGPEYYNFDSPNPSVDCCPGRGYEDNHTDFIWEYQNVSANDQVGEVIEHLLHTITGVGFAREFPEWNWYDENSKIYLAMNEAVEKNIYDISSYQEIKNNGDMEGYNKVTVQEFSFWVIVTSWGYSDIYDLPHGEFKISSINQVRTELPIAFELYVDTIEKILTVPDKDFLKSLFS